MQHTSHTHHTTHTHTHLLLSFCRVGTESCNEAMLLITCLTCTILFNPGQDQKSETDESLLWWDCVFFFTWPVPEQGQTPRTPVLLLFLTCLVERTRCKVALQTSLFSISTCGVRDHRSPREKHLMEQQGERDGAMCFFYSVPAPSWSCSVV